MLNFIKRHEKKAIALVMVLLMITFVASTGYGRGSNATANQRLVGTLGGTKIYSTELSQSRQEWQMANQYVKFPDRNTGEMVPFGAQVFFSMQVPEAYQAIQDRPELFMLLRHEAREAPVQVNTDELEEIMANFYQPPATADDPDGLRTAVREAVGDLLLIQANCERIAGQVKVSAPLRDRNLAELLQQVTLNLIPLSADSFAASAPPATPQQADAQFKKYADTEPGRPTTDNPFGFGYKLPERVKLQYLKIDRADAARVVESQKTPYDWDVAARLYYLRHPDDYRVAATTAPSSMPTTAAAALPTSQPTTQTASAVSTLMPFEKARPAALESVRQPLVDKLMADVQAYVISAMTTAAGEATGPATTLPSADALRKIAKTAQARFGVKLEPSNWDDRFYAAKELSLILPSTAGLLADASLEAPAPAFAELVMQQATANLGRSDLGSAAARAALLTPAPPVVNAGTHDVYIFRLIDARPAEAAHDLTDAGGLPLLDLRTQAGFDAAQAAGKGLLAIAQKSTLAAAARGAGLTVISSPPISLQSRSLGTDLPLSPAGETNFIRQSMDLLGQYRPASQPHPFALISVPQDRRVFVAQLDHVSATADPQTVFGATVQLTEELRREDAGPLLREWCTYDAVVARLGYKAEPVKE